MLREATVVLFTLIVAPAASAQGLQTCTVGTHIDAIGSSGSGTIIDTDEGQGSYLVRYDNSTIEEWVTSPLLASGCVGAPAGPSDASFYVGEWDEVHQRGETDLVIHSDGTYEWLISIQPAEIVRGDWHAASADQLGSLSVGPGVVLSQGEYGHDWVIESRASVDNENREVILAQDDDGNYHYFSRSN